MKNLSIKLKIGLGFAAVMCLMVVSIGLSIYELKKLESLQNTLIEKDLNLINGIYSLEKSLLGVALQMREVGSGLKFNNKPQIEGGLKAMQRYKDSLPSIIDIIKKNYDGDAKSMDTMLKTASEFVSVHFDYSKIEIAGKSTKDIFFNRMKPVKAKMWPLFLPLQKQAKKQVLQREQELASLAKETEIILIAALVISIVLSIFIVLFVSKNILSSVEKVKRTADELEKGNLSSNCELNQKDEMGLMASSLNNSIDKIRSMIADVKSLGSEIQTSTQSLDTAISSVERLSETQVNETTQVAASAEELVATLSEVAASTSETFSLTQNLKENVEQANNSTQEANNLFVTVNKDMVDSADKMEQLEQQSKDIVTILDAIKSISEQTNLLALNAAIEAARAGEQGRGFAVVADEVRNLAQKTQDSTAEIEDLFNSLQVSTQQAVGSIRSTGESIHQGADLMNASMNMMSDMSTRVNDITEKLTHVSNATKEQSDVSKGISQSAANLKNFADDISNQLLDTKKHNQVLLSENDKLKSQIDFFKV